MEWVIVGLLVLNIVLSCVLIYETGTDLQLRGLYSKLEKLEEKVSAVRYSVDSNAGDILRRIKETSRSR